MRGRDLAQNLLLAEQVPQIKAAVKELLEAIQMVTETAQSCRADDSNEASSSSSSGPSAHKSSSRVAAKLAEARHAADHCSEWADQIEVAATATMLCPDAVSALRNCTGFTKQSEGKICMQLPKGAWSQAGQGSCAMHPGAYTPSCACKHNLQLFQDKFVDTDVVSARGTDDEW